MTSRGNVGKFTGEPVYSFRDELPSESSVTFFHSKLVLGDHIFSVERSPARRQLARNLHIHMATIKAEPTPNPNSLKFETDQGRFIDDRMAAFSSKEEAESHPLARRLFSISGVTDVFITPEFVTVSKQPAVEWSQAKSEIETLLQEHLEEA